ncbi:MAG: sodium:proton antiporter, partial [Anaerolineae bacterium]|nr:sodium:proton antiporter [Anaerolineae bacterium]
MTEQLLVGLAAVLVLGTLAQWLAWRLRLPSILLLLLAGFVAGPVTHVLNPDELLGDLLFPAVSLSVAIILFEGGTSLNLRELREVGQVVRRLVSVGVVVTWAIGTAAAYFLLNMPLELSLLLGAILVVSGPTVMMPLLRHVRPTKRVSSALKWEGILIDPVGATLAVLVFEVILAGEALETVPLALVSGVIRTVIIGGVAGVLGAVLLYLPLRRYLIPDSLQTTVTLMMVVAAFVASNHFQPESGLLTVTVMGVILANQRAINIRGIVKFKENLVTVLLSSIFILLAARVQMSDISQLGLNSLLFLAVLIFIARPLTAFVSTIGSEMTWRERAFLGWLAPRGIVAAAVSAIFALELSHIGYAGAEALMPVTLLVIVGTVSIYGLSAAYVARWLKVSQPEPQGVLMVGAHPWAREIALALKDNGITVLLVDSNWGNIHAARMLGLSTYYGNVLSEDTMEDIPLDGIGRLMALTRNDEV